MPRAGGASGGVGSATVQGTRVTPLEAAPGAASAAAGAAPRARGGDGLLLARALTLDAVGDDDDDAPALLVTELLGRVWALPTGGNASSVATRSAYVVLDPVADTAAASLRKVAVEAQRRGQRGAAIALV